MPSKRTPVTSRLTDVRSNKCRLTCAHCGCNVDIHTHSWYARASLPRNRFLFHINCNMIVSNKCSSHFLLQQSLFSWLLHQHHLSTNKSGHFQTSWLLFARLYNYSLPTRICVLRKHKTQQYESDPGILLSHLHIYWSTPRSPRSRLLVIRYLPNLPNMTLVAIIVMLINLWRGSLSLGWHGSWSRVLCSLLNGIFYSNIRYNFVLTIKSSCLLHICSVSQGLVLIETLTKSTETWWYFQPMYLSVSFSLPDSPMMKPTLRLKCFPEGTLITNIQGSTSLNKAK